uniref:Protein phosphatase 1 regulatory inhibitor subunit 1C n=1 Tax=Apteryx owenii TaxID=8824 RepID=A0A8B9S458_APTOW
MEPNSPKKIQFAVPPFQSQIDPEAAEQIRKRRPTPASLVIMNEHTQSASPKQRKQSVYTPPAIKGTVQALPGVGQHRPVPSHLSGGSAPARQGRGRAGAAQPRAGPQATRPRSLGQVHLFALTTS